MYIPILLQTFVCVYVCPTYVYAHMYLCMHLCMYVCMHMYISAYADFLSILIIFKCMNELHTYVCTHSVYIT